MPKAPIKKPRSASSGCFFVKTKKAKSGNILWYLYHEYYVKNKRDQKPAPKNLYHRFGLNPEMSVIEAKERVKRLNKERRLEAGSHIRAAKNAEENVAVDKTYFPEDYVEEFLSYLEEQTHGTSAHYKKVVSHFVLIQKMIKKLRLTPGNYVNRSGRIYKYFSENGYSIDYTNKILRVLNMWGGFVARKEGLYYERVKSPKGRVRSSIRSSQLKKTSVRRESLPLTPEMLAKAKHSMSKEHYNWLVLSVWFGLRPKEIDGLKNETTFRVESHPHHIPRAATSIDNSPQ